MVCVCVFAFFSVCVHTNCDLLKNVFQNNFLNLLSEHLSAKPEHAALQSSCFYVPSAEMTRV